MIHNKIIHENQYWRWKLQKLIQAAQIRWDNLHMYQAACLGVSACLVTGVFPGFIFGDAYSAIGFLTLFPFFARLIIKAFCVGPYLYQVFRTKFGIFCLSWHFTFMYFAWEFFGWD